MSMEIIKRKMAKRLGLEWYYTGKSCKHGHFSKRYLSCNQCMVCNFEWREKNKERLALQAKIRHQNNRERDRQRYQKWYQENMDHHHQYSKNYNNENKINVKKQQKEWRKNNPDRLRANHAKRRAQKLLRTPSWLTKQHFIEMEGFYVLSRTLGFITETPYHVDHIYPLQGKTCSGLHVPWNLQVIPASVNISKHNKMPEDFNQ